ncbi:MAG TPA: hypothetical protein VNE39_05715 [Planctomycetota bacterium]|nr:hypothetical protein [Planctomycetota bacterium]
MVRYRITVYYEDKATNTRVAQNVVAIAADDRAALELVKSQIGPEAVGGRLAAIHVAEKAPVVPGIVYRGDPYIPFRWPSSEAPGK